MPVFKYIGDKREMKNCYGYDFSNWENVDVDEEDVHAIKKFSNNSHFKQIGGEINDPDINCDFAIFRVQGNGKNYSKPDKVVETKGEAEEYVFEMSGDDKERVILRRVKA